MQNNQLSTLSMCKCQAMAILQPNWPQLEFLNFLLLSLLAVTAIIDLNCLGWTSIFIN